MQYDSELELEWDDDPTKCRSDADAREGLMVSAFDMKVSLPAVTGVGGIVDGRRERGFGSRGSRSRSVVGH